MTVGNTGPACRIWIFNHYATPPDEPGGTRHYWVARAIAERGGSATIFAAGIDHATGLDRRLRGRRFVRTEIKSGATFVWVRTIPYRGNGWQRVLNMLSYAALVVVAQIGRPRPTVVVGSSVHPFAALAGWLVARLHRATFVYEVRDLWPQTMIDIGALSERSIGARMLYAIESFLVHRAASVVTVLQGMAAYLDARGLPNHHVRYLPNGTDLTRTADDLAATPSNDSDPIAGLLAEIDDRHRRGELIVAWTGAHGRVNGLDVAIRAMALADRPDHPRLRLLLVGDGPEKPALSALATEVDAPVTFHDPIRKTDIPRLLGAVDIALLHARATPVHRYGVSFNKLFDYMAASLPIVFACDAFGDPVQAAGAGVTVPPDDPEALADGLRGLASMPADERRRLGAAGRTFVERHHDLARIGAAYADLVGCASEVGTDRAPGRT